MNAFFDSVTTCYAFIPQIYSYAQIHVGIHIYSHTYVHAYTHLHIHTYENTPTYTPTGVHLNHQLVWLITGNICPQLNNSLTKL